MSPTTPWWQSYFSTHYAKLYRGVLADELHTDDEVAMLARVFAGAPGVVLDLACGYGRHLIPLRREGIAVAGLDYSNDLLRALPKRDRKMLVRGDMRSLPFGDATLGGAYMMFNSFGYFADEENVALLGEIARVLRPGAAFVVDLPARAGMKRAIAATPSSIGLSGNVRIQESWDFDAAGKRAISRGVWELGTDRKEWELALRLYTPAEFDRMLMRAGFAEREIRPLENLAALGAGAAPAALSTGTTNMIVRAVRG